MTDTYERVLPAGNTTPSAGAPARARGTGLARVALAGIARAARAVHWYMTTLMGDRAYDVYVAHLAREHPGATPLTERQFWRQKMDDQDRNPGARCC